MGNSGSKGGKGTSLLGGKSKKKGGDDGLIGNRKVRTIILSIILIAWAAMAVSYLIDQADFYNNFVNVQIVFVTYTCDSCKDMANAYTMAYVGCFVIIASAIFAILLFFINCDDKVGRIAGVGLIIGGILYLGGWLWFVSQYRNKFPDSIWDNFSDDTKNRINSVLSAWVGEAVLPSVGAMLLGLDVFMHLFDDEAKRLATNLLNIFVVACLAGPVYYTQSQDISDEDQFILTLFGGFPPNSDAYPWIGSGYLVLGIFSLTYVILYICTCCTCDCKDTRCIRLLMALGLIAGGVLGAIGYYIYAGQFTSDSADSASDYTVYYIGYTVLIIGFPVVWALDIGIDDMKGN